MNQNTGALKKIKLEYRRCRYDRPQGDVPGIFRVDTSLIWRRRAAELKRVYQ